MTKPLPFGLRIRELRKARGWTLDDLAGRMTDTDGGTPTKATVSKIELSTRLPSGEWLQRLAAAFELSVGELLGEPAAPSAARWVPIVGKISAGNWQEAIQSPHGHVRAIDVTDEAFALEPDGDSMDLAIPAGARVIIEPREKQLRDAKMYAVMNGDGETTLKMFRTDPARLEPRSSNPIHQPIILGNDPFEVVGRVTQIIIPV